MAIFSGNVSVVQGPTLLKAGKMTVYYAKDGGGSATTGSANIDRLEVEDKVFVKSETQTATGDKGSFDMKTEVLNLTGKEVVLSEGENVLTGCKPYRQHEDRPGRARRLRRAGQDAADAKFPAAEPVMAADIPLFSRLGSARKPATPPIHADKLKGTLIARGLTKSYKGRQVVNGVSFGVRAGEAVGLLGPNGAGKTTCFYMVTGLVPVDQGKIEIDGFDVTADADVPPRPPGRRLPAAGSLDLPRADGRGQHPRRAGSGRKEPQGARTQPQTRCSTSSTSPICSKSPAIALSGGERRRLEIARALASRPSYMLLDEPFAGIDPIAVADIQQLVRHLTQRGIGVLVTDHNVRETLGLIDRAYIIHAGEVLAHGLPTEIVANPDVRRLYLGEGFTL